MSSLPLSRSHIFTSTIHSIRNPYRRPSAMFAPFRERRMCAGG